MKIEIATDPTTKVRTATILIVGAELDLLYDVCDGYYDEWGDYSAAVGFMAEAISEALDIAHPNGPAEAGLELGKSIMQDVFDGLTAERTAIVEAVETLSP
jgi:hypothetical protein